VLGLTGRDEVALILPGISATEVAPLLDELIGELTGPFQFAGGASVDVQLTAGVAAFPEHAADVDELVMAADAALAEAAPPDRIVVTAL
jgi:GGDEF domain-containing protein